MWHCRDQDHDDVALPWFFSCRAALIDDAVRTAMPVRGVVREQAASPLGWKGRLPAVRRNDVMSLRL
jgi:hypothetical protein